MRNMLFLIHRIPYPPEKGEKIRAWHLFEHFSRTYRMHLGCLIDAEEDWQHVPFLRGMCADFHAARLDQRRKKILSFARLRPGRPFTLEYFHDAGLQAWVDRMLATVAFDRVFVFSSGMAEYLDRARAGCDLTLDMSDVDSQKWRAYAADARGPLKLLWAREARLLLEFERRVAVDYDRTLLVSDPETEEFAELSPASRDRVFTHENGVDLARFSPAHSFERPFEGAGPHLVFTGTMDYWPNEDGCGWFAREVMPGLRARHPDLAFHIVGANPTPGVLALARLPGIHVTGRVPDVRPYVAHSDVMVTPLRIARGLQNKLLEAMAMGRPLVSSRPAYEGVRAEEGRDLLVAGDAAGMQAAIFAVLDGQHPELGARARAAMERYYSWPASLARLDALMGAPVLEPAT
jgi:sugar transferase (PEP-CTERM/EpsH1 system associated)